MNNKKRKKERMTKKAKSKIHLLKLGFPKCPMFFNKSQHKHSRKMSFLKITTRKNM
jgi:hypothetical protein